MQQESELEELLGADLLDVYAERLARREVLAAMVPDGHPVLDAELRLLTEAERDVSLLLSSRPGAPVVRIATHVLSRAAAFLRSYGVPKKDVGDRLTRIRPSVERAARCVPFAAGVA
jgi:hypothetical protein